MTKQPRLQRLLGMDEAKPVKVTGRAIGDLSGCDFVEFAGHQAFIVESEWDEQTGCSTFTALLRGVEMPAKKLPFPVSIHALVPGTTAQVITFYANDEDVSEVPTIDIDSSDPNYYIHGYAVQEGDNVIYLELPGGEDVVTISDPLGNFEPWTQEVDAGDGQYGVAVECEYIEPDGADIIVGFSVIGKTDGSDFRVSVEDENNVEIQAATVPASAGPLQDYYICSSSDSGVAIRVKTPTDEWYWLIVTCAGKSASSKFRNPYYAGI